MADNVKQQENQLFSTEEVTNLNGGAVTAQQLQRLILAPRTADGTAVDITSGNALPVADAAAAAKLAELVTLLGGTIKVGDGSGLLTVEVGAALPAGTNNIGDVDVVGGTVAHDAADSGNPLKVGGRVRTALEAISAQNDRSDLILDKFGRTLATTAPLDQRVSATLNRTTNEAGQLLAAVGSTAYVITNVKVINGHASQGTKVEILDEASVKDKGFAGPNGGGWEASNPDGLFVCSANSKLNGKCVTGGADVDIFVSGYKVPA